MLLGDIIRLNGRKFPEKVAIISGERTTTFGELHDRVLKVANAMLDIARPGDRIAVLAENITEYVEMYYGVPSAGMALTFLNVMVVDEQMEACPPGVVGEIVIRGEQVLKGYFGNEDGTAKAFEHGWFYTGDMARRDDEGYFYIVDRMKDMIITGGENVYSREVEEVLYIASGRLGGRGRRRSGCDLGREGDGRGRASSRDDGDRSGDHRGFARQSRQLQEAEVRRVPR